MDVIPEYNKLKELAAIIEQDRFVNMIGILMKEQVTILSEKLGLKSPKIISVTPDRPNIFLEGKMKVKSNDVLYVDEDVFKQECLDLTSHRERFQGQSCIYIPMSYMSCAIMF